MYQRLDDYLAYHARVHGNVVFVSQGSRRLSFAQAESRVQQISNRLHSAGLVKGDRIALLGKNSIDFLFLYLASSKLGLVPVGINYRLSAGECAFVIRDSTARYLFCDGEFIDAVSRECSHIPSVSLYGDYGDYPPFESWLLGADKIHLTTEVHASDVLSQMYTSGTTGFPKGGFTQPRQCDFQRLPDCHGVGNHLPGG